MVYTKSYYGQPALWYIIDPALSNVEILRVTRNGLVHNRTGEETILSLEYFYSFGGAINFDPTNPFTVDGDPDAFGWFPSQLEKIQVKYRV